MMVRREEAVVLKPGRDKPIRQGHPWIFSGGIRHIPNTIQDGDVVAVHSSSGDWLAQGYLNRRSQIQVRLFSWDAQETIDDAFWRRRLERAIARRSRLQTSPHTDTYRLVNGENDYVPGLVVDRYGAILVMQVGTLGIERRKQQLAAILQDLTGCTGIVERSELGARRQEGLQPAHGLLVGTAPAAVVQVRESGYHFLVDLAGGQKTGFYTDQRENRRRVAAYCANAEVLNAFSYTGAFAVHALAAGARSVVNVDTSVEALALGEQNLRLNGLDRAVSTQHPALCRSEHIAGDVFQVLRQWRADGRRFHVVVLDPPKFAHNQRNVEAALRGYKDINLLALQLLHADGILATFSCSGLVAPDLFQKVVFGAAVDAGRSVQILEWLHQASDHPVAITFPEGAYLKGLLCRVGQP